MISVHSCDIQICRSYAWLTQIWKHIAEISNTSTNLKLDHALFELVIAVYYVVLELPDDFIQTIII